MAIPVVPLVWSDKVVKFSELLNNKNYFWPDKENGEKVGRLLLMAETDSKLENKIETLKKSSKTFIERSINSK